MSAVPYGQMEQDATGDHIRCHACGEWFVSVAAHVFMTHEMTAAEYREAYGLNKRQPLMAPAECERRRANREHLLKYHHLNTPEKRSKVGNPGPRRAQHAASLAETQATEEHRAKISDALKGKPKPYMADRNRTVAEPHRETRQCVVCGTSFRIKKSHPKVCCSPECRTARKSEQMRDNRLNPHGRRGKAGQRDA